MKHQKYLIQDLFLLVLLAGLWTGCQTIAPAPMPAGANPSEEIDKLQKDLNGAIGEQVDALAPTNFRDAQKELDEARKMRDAGKSIEKVLEKVGEGRAYLDKANRFATISRTALGDAVVQRGLAVKFDASKYANKEFSPLDADFKKAAQKVENNDTSFAEQSAGKLADGFRKVKVQAIKVGKLGQAEKDINQAQKEEAKKFVPKTLKETTSAYQKAIAAIDQTPDDPNAWNAQTEAARNAAARLLKFARDGKAIGGRNPEGVLLQREANEKTIAEKTSAVTALERQNSAQQAAIAGMSGSKRLDELFQKAKRDFTASEADVVRENDSLVIKLKKVGFAQGSADIPSDAYDLLNKVGKVVQSFDKSHVTVAGFANDGESSASSQDLSERRAAAVAQYLVTGGSIAPDAIRSEGHGGSKAAVDNAEKGQEQNRSRVDITIVPEQK